MNRSKFIAKQIIVSNDGDPLVSIYICGETLAEIVETTHKLSEEMPEADPFVSDLLVFCEDCAGYRQFVSEDLQAVPGFSVVDSKHRSHVPTEDLN